MMRNLTDKVRTGVILGSLVFSAGYSIHIGFGDPLHWPLFIVGVSCFSAVVFILRRYC